MQEKRYDFEVAVIGAGPAGLAAAIAARRQGAKKVIIIERDTAPGGILQQCIHAGFGLSYFQKELTGPEYAGRFIKQAKEEGVELLLDSMVLNIEEDDTILCSNPGKGLVYVRAGAVVLAMGCRERTRFNLRIPGTRPAGVYTAGAAQRLINRQNEMVGKKVVILGSGDIGMIMARRMTLEGAKVEAVVEIMDYLAGLTRNKVQCLDDFDIPLLLGHTVTRITGEYRVEGVWIAQVDEHRRPDLSTERFIACDTLLLSVGLLPENELTRAAGIRMSAATNGPMINQYMQTSRADIFACGNVVHVNDLADNVSAESELAGRSAARYVLEGFPKRNREIPCTAGSGIRYVCPQMLSVREEEDADCKEDQGDGRKIEGCGTITGDREEIRLYFRVKAPGAKTTLTARCGGRVIAERTVRRVNPGEMEHIDIHAEILTGAEDTEITVEAREVG